MSRQKPNESCNCKSGRKYKKCHGATGRDYNEIEPTPKRQNSSMSGILGLPGIGLLFGYQRRSSEMNNPMNKTLPEGAPGKYRVRFVLSRPMFSPLEENHLVFDLDNSAGNSHFFIDRKPNQIEFLNEIEEGQQLIYKGYVNKEGYLSSIEIEELDADNFKDAIYKALVGLNPLLGRLAITLDIPMNIFQTSATELSSNNTISDLTIPFIEKSISTLVDTNVEDSFNVYSDLYKEALNCNSVNYQFLCFYKIIERVNRDRVRRTRKAERERKKREKQEIFEEQSVSEILPVRPVDQIKWLNNLYIHKAWSPLALSQIFLPEAIGQPFENLVGKDKILYNIRNAIAHAFIEDSDEEPLADDITRLYTVRNWLPLCKCLALHLVKQEFPDMFPDGLNPSNS